MTTKLPLFLDNNATTAVAPEIIKELIDLLAIPGNASSVENAHGLLAKKTVDDSITTIRKFFKVPNSYKVVFTSGTTESANTIIRSVIEDAIEPPKIICSAVEHPCILQTLEYFAEKEKCILEIIGVDALGRLKIDDLENKSIDAKLGCFMAVQNEIGNIYPIEKIGKILKKNNCKFLCDGSQAVGKIKLNIIKSNVDFFFFSGHKIKALQGIGCIISKNTFTPLLIGGAQQNGLRAGTYNLPGILSLARALEIIEQYFDKNILNAKKQKNKIWTQIKQRWPNALENGDIDNKVPHNLNFSIPGEINTMLLMQLRNEMSISTGAACSTGVVSQSKVLKAMGLETKILDSVLRIGM